MGLFIDCNGGSTLVEHATVYIPEEEDASAERIIDNYDNERICCCVQLVRCIVQLVRSSYTSKILARSKVY